MCINLSVFQGQAHIKDKSHAVKPFGVVNANLPAPTLGV
jgi:hypothetical protein